ncbi:MAG: AAA family ATPase [bacterium]
MTDLAAPAAALRATLRDRIARVFIGPERIVDHLLVALIAPGHVLLEGVPGVAKTTLAKAFSATTGCDFRRIQFTPDLLPADITGSYILNLRDQQFVLRKGPVFAHVVLGDEINRAPAKTQSALLEAMQEGQVTIEGETLRLPEPFLVLATQNPLEQEGVYPLPEAQVDRFLMRSSSSTTPTWPERSGCWPRTTTHPPPSSASSIRPPSWPCEPRRRPSTSAPRSFAISWVWRGRRATTTRCGSGRVPARA